MTKSKKLLLLILVTVLLVCLAVASTACTPSAPPIPQSSWQVASPNGNIVVTLDNSAVGKLSYSVKSGDQAVVDSSPMGFLLEEDNLTQILSFEGIKNEKIQGSYDNVSGRNSKVDYDCNQATITLKGSLYYLDVIIRAYDDGYAFRYNIRTLDGESGVAHVASEQTTFTLPTDSLIWMQTYTSNLASQGDFFSYEERYSRYRSDSVDDYLVVMPLMYRVGKSQTYSLITESALIGSGYWGSFLKDNNADGVGNMQTVHNVAGAMENDTQISLPFTSPWRVASVGTLAQVQDSEMVEKVYDDASYWKPDNYDTLSEEEKSIYTYDWVEPGVTAWNWLIETSYSKVSQADWEMQYKYVDLAAEKGWKYTVLDGGWDQNMVKVTEFTNYAKEKGVKVIVWCDAYADYALGTSVDALRQKLQTWQSWGIAGIKIDFFDGQTNPGKLTHQGEDSLTIKWYESIYQECAKLKMVVNCHGCNKPTGERRVYPNVINREAIFGNELYPASGDATINNLFVRGSVGPTDFTPLIQPLRTTLTMGHQMALAALYESGQPSMGGRNTHYTADLDDFYKMLSASRDQTKFLCGELDGYYVAAYRKGESWIVAGANAAALTRNASIKFDFLGEGNYNAVIYTDVENEQSKINKTTETITNQTSKEMSMYPNGGFVICLTPTEG